ncbi:hypothetical protein LWI29_018739 [Acer saccharum]|uniref:Pentatricopeptide repeat-containing protein n=1 Tax=Acer saccharum TaxID=4024 RepID=A0AA39SUG7_ACESA|nr:hypothetical protein LWI29_018739 [Acer saccharum]
MEAYQAWKKKNSIAPITLLSSMADDMMCGFEEYETAQAMWIALKDKFVGTSTTKLRRLTIKFNTYRKCQNHTMRQHQREMSNMMRELKNVEHVLTDEQQIPNVIMWNPMISGYAKNDYAEEAVKLFREMIYKNIGTDSITVSSAILACA